MTLFSVKVTTAFDAITINLWLLTAMGVSQTFCVFSDIHSFEELTRYSEENPCFQTFLLKIRLCLWVIHIGVLAAFLSVTRRYPRLSRHVFFTSPQVCFYRHLFLLKVRGQIETLPSLSSTLYSHESVYKHMCLCSWVFTHMCAYVYYIHMSVYSNLMSVQGIKYLLLSTSILLLSNNVFCWMKSSPF